MSNSTPNQPNPQPQRNFLTISGAVVLAGVIGFFANISQIGGFALDVCEKYDIPAMRSMCPQAKSLPPSKNTDPADVVEPQKEPPTANSADNNIPIEIIRATPNPSLQASPVQFRRPR